MKRFIRACALLCAVLFLLPLAVEALGKGQSMPVSAASGDRVTRILLMGCDRSTKLTDSILLVTVNETQKKASIVQIPRDTYAEYTKKDYKKLNGAMSALGASACKDFLSDALGVRIHHFVILKLDFFRKLVDDIGGVELQIPQDMYYSDPEQDLTIALPKGRMRLSGAQAEQFVRYRSGYVNADLGRLDAQKLFLAAFAKQCKSLSWLTVLRILGHALTGVQTDLGIVSAARLLKVLRACDVDAVPMVTLAGQAVRGQSGAWYYVLNRAGVTRAVQEHLMPTEPVKSFDPRGLFDRESNPDFHRIYQAPEAQLPLLDISGS
ncbi:MAG: LCP family protein [Clostridia bacterium]|nr:LCP family protein [Clostridia bacterium]